MIELSRKATKISDYIIDQKGRWVYKYVEDQPVM